jgi:hypothetical protein
MLCSQGCHVFLHNLCQSHSVQFLNNSLKIEWWVYVFQVSPFFTVTALNWTCCFRWCTVAKQWGSSIRSTYKGGRWLYWVWQTIGFTNRAQLQCWLEREDERALGTLSVNWDLWLPIGREGLDGPHSLQHHLWMHLYTCYCHLPSHQSSH